MNAMPQEWILGFMHALIELQKHKGVMWVQTRWVATAMFGYPLNDKEFKKNKMRVHRLGDILEKKKLIKVTYRRKRLGNSKGTSLIKYYSRRKVNV